MEQPQPLAQQFSSLMNQIETGTLKIPQFQREFVWNRHKSAKLLDSLLKGYPIGTFILWKTKEQLRSIKNLGNLELPPTAKGDFIHYVLDGQQRLTTLFATVKGLSVPRDGHMDDFSQMFIDLEAAADEDLVVTDVSEKADQSYISVRDLLNAEFTALAAFPDQYHEKMKAYKKILEGYNFSVILVPEAPIDVATEIFTRINVTGQPLSVFEIMVAKTYSMDRDFDLAEKTTGLIEDLAEAKFGTVPDIVILQTLSALMAKDSSKKAILRLNRDKFIDTWPAAVDAIKLAVDYFRSALKVPVSQLLPYKALIVPFAYFFHHHPKRPTGQMKTELNELFWRVSLGGYYSWALESHLAVDIRRIDAILAGKAPSYDYPVDTSKEFVMDNGWFRTGRSFIKAILCVLASKRPTSFKDDDAEVNISNDWLKQANSRNYHHFFPKAYLRKQGVSSDNANHIANITLVDDELNKRDIGAKKPSDYMRRFQRQNPKMQKTMRRHLIDLDRDGVWVNDYDRFIKRRSAAIARELASRVTPRHIDEKGQALAFDDYEAIEITEREGVEEAAA
jgi:hypothetical protein